MKQGPEARSAAYEILASVSRGLTMDRALADALEGVGPRDRRLAHEIAAGVLRHRRVLDLTINRALSRPDSRLPAPLREVLRIGVYQMHFLDKIPAYAAVAATVDLARTVSGERGAKLTNAVLRQITRTGRVDDEQWTVAERFSHPDWLVRRWMSRYGTEDTQRLLAHNNRKPVTVIQPARWTQEQIQVALDNAGVTSRIHQTGRGLEVPETDVQELPGYREGGFIVQDPAQRLLLEFAAIPSRTRVWDVCAAPGGKAVTLSREREVIASDSARDRMVRLRENANRAAPELNMLVADALTQPMRSQSFDAVVVDAPCSATGTIARHPDARWALSPKRIRTLVQRQTLMLEGVADAVRPGGLLVYLTCSLEKEENEEQVDKFLESHATFERTLEDRFIFPPDSGTDGGFGARMRRCS